MKSSPELRRATDRGEGPQIEAKGKRWESLLSLEDTGKPRSMSSRNGQRIQRCLWVALETKWNAETRSRVHMPYPETGLQQEKVALLGFNTDPSGSPRHRQLCHFPTNPGHHQSNISRSHLLKSVLELRGQERGLLGPPR